MRARRSRRSSMSSACIRRVRVTLRTDERCGGLWYISPRNIPATSARRSFVGSAWKRASAWYSLAPSSSTPRAFVASPRPRGSTPVTGGSSVPLCPAFSIPSRRFAQATASWLVGPGGLSSRIMPYSRSFSTGRASYRTPCAGSVSSSSITRMSSSCGRRGGGAAAGDAGAGCAAGAGDAGAVRACHRPAAWPRV